jgi:hypothetical protein
MFKRVGALALLLSVAAVLQPSAFAQERWHDNDRGYHQNRDHERRERREHERREWRKHERREDRWRGRDYNGGWGYRNGGLSTLE